MKTSIPVLLVLAIGSAGSVVALGYQDPVLAETSTEVAVAELPQEPQEVLIPVEVLEESTAMVAVAPESAGPVLPASAAMGSPPDRSDEEPEVIIAPDRMDGFFSGRGPIHQPEAVALLLAKMCVSEEGWQPRGCPALWQVIENVRSRSCERALECVNGEETHLSAMMRLSPRVSGRRPPGTTRVANIAGLTDSDTVPPTWVECEPGQETGCSGTWERYVPRWQRVRQFAAHIIAQRNIEQCPAPVISWGGAMDDDHMSRRNERRVEAGSEPLLRVACDGTANRFYAPASLVRASLRLPTPGVPEEADEQVAVADSTNRQE